MKFSLYTTVEPAEVILQCAALAGCPFDTERAGRFANARETRCGSPSTQPATINARNVKNLRTR